LQNTIKIIVYQESKTGNYKFLRMMSAICSILPCLYL
jgi:hypothetical protein